MPRKVKAVLEKKETNILMAQQNVYERKQKSPRKRVDSIRSNEDLEVAEEASGSYRFVFPPPPPVPIPCVSRRPVSASPYYYVSDSDSQSDSGRGGVDLSSPIAIRHPFITFRGYQSDGSPVALQSLPRFLPPIGVFWDIENCQVPKGRSAIAVAQVIRDKFFNGYREAEFIVVCDVKKENSQVIQELNDAQVNLIHVASTCKNAADDKLRQSIRRFADIHGSPAAIILISGDINFAADLTDLKHRKKMHVILLHNSSASEALILCASEHHNFTNLMEDVPMRGTVKSSQPFEMVVSNLPEDKDQSRIKNRLKQLSGNCGGRVMTVCKTSATLRFSTMEFASRAQKRMDGEDVFGRKIVVNHPTRITESARKEGSPTKMYSGRKFKYSVREDEDMYTAARAPGFYNSTPAGLNVLSSIHIPNSWNSTSRGNSPLHGNSRERTPDGYRRIKGAHRVSVSDENSSVDAELEQRWKKCRTPSPYADTEQELERYFHPISAVKPPPVELIVTNLDQNLDAKELRHILLGVFREHVMVVNVSVFVQSDGNYAAHVKVPSLQDAQYAISQLHRRKVGYKRILISYANSAGPSPQLIRSQIVSLLLEVPGHRLPLFKFRELFESRYLASISVSDMYKLRDVCLITEEAMGRMVTLNPDHRNTPSPCNAQDGQQMELPYCTLHSRKPAPDKGWAEQEMGSLPNVRIGLKVFALHIHTLLQTHNGSLPLPSLPTCYEAQFEKLAVDETGVPLEHLVSCLPGVEIYQGVGCVKYLRWLKSKANGDAHSEELVKCVSPPLAMQLAQLSRELVDLLKTAPHCQLLFNRFIPAYHHHFGRQCRVADYGFTKLIDLMEALPHVVQVMGEGNRRVITLSHRAQVRRFTSDLLRVLKSQASKQVSLSEFPLVYQKVMGRSWDIVDYGVCELRDLLVEVSENTVMITHQWGKVLIEIPKREQTAEEREKTKQFAAEVVELLRHAPQCSMQFNKFIPAYHHHFGHQCRVADYGFTKLIELFEAIPHVVKVEDEGEGERRVSLTLDERLRVLGEQVSTLVRSRRTYMTLPVLAAAFLQSHGYALRPDNYECSSLIQLMQKLHHTIKLLPSPSGPIVMLVDRTKIHHLSLQVRRILMEHPEGKMSSSTFLAKYKSLFQQNLDLQQLDAELIGIVQLNESGSEVMVELSPIQKFARNVYHLLFENNGRLPLSAFEPAYLRKYGVACQPAQYGQTNVISLLLSIPETVLVCGRANKKTLILNKELAVVGLALPAKMNEQNGAYSDEEVENCAPSSSSSPPTPTAKGSQQEDEELVPDKFLRSILSNGNGSHFMFDSPDSPNRAKGGSAPPWPNVSPPPFHFPSGCLPHVVPPDPSELPLPQMNGIRSEEDKNTSGESTPNRTRRKRRLAAQFNTPIQM